MIRTIEKSSCHVIQKVTNGSKTIGYNVVPQGLEGDAGAVRRYSSLAEAREAAGIVYAHGVKQPKLTVTQPSA